MGITNCPKCNADGKELSKDNVHLKAAFKCYSCIILNNDKFIQSKTCRVGELENAIRKHRSQKADDRCIFDDDELYSVLNDGIKCDRKVGSKADMLKNCERFIQNRCETGGWKSYIQLEAELEEALVVVRKVAEGKPGYSEDAQQLAKKASEGWLLKELDRLKGEVARLSDNLDKRINNG